VSGAARAVLDIVSRDLGEAAASASRYVEPASRTAAFVQWRRSRHHRRRGSRACCGINPRP